MEGLLQETTRDSGHANMALAGMVDAAETARQQELDLYGEQGVRITAGLECQARYLPPHNEPPPPNLEFNTHPTWEIAHNPFHDRMGQALPRMAAVLERLRPTGVNHHMNWETLTHAGAAMEVPGGTAARHRRKSFCFTLRSQSSAAAGHHEWISSRAVR